MPKLKNSLFLALAKKTGFPSKAEIRRLKEVRGKRSLFAAAIDEGLLDAEKARAFERKARKLSRKLKRRKHSEPLARAKVGVKPTEVKPGRPEKKAPPAPENKASPRPTEPVAAKPAPPAPGARRLVVPVAVVALILALSCYVALGSKKPATEPAPGVSSVSASVAAVVTADVPVEPKAPAEPRAPLEAPRKAPVVDPTIGGWKIRVEKPGLVSVVLASLPELSSAALDASHPALLLSSLGKPVPYYLDGGRLVFQAESDPDSKDERGRCYHLRVAGAGEKPNGLASAGPAASAANGAAGLVTLAPEETRAYDPLPVTDPAAVTIDGSKGGYRFFAGHLTFKLEARATGPSTLRLSGLYVKRPIPRGDEIQRLAKSKKQPPVALAVKLGDRRLADLELGKKLPAGDEAVIEVPADALAEGANRIELAVDKGLTVLVRQATLECRVAIACDGVASRSFRACDRATALSGLPASGLVADLTTGELLPVVRSATGATVASPEGHELLAFDPPRASDVPVGAIEPCRRSDLEKPGTGADWLAIAPRELVASVEPLAAHRSKEGLRSRVVALEDVEDAFHDGSFGPAAIRAFLAFTQESWSPRPRFVLLVGDASHDSRPRNPEGALVPTALVDTLDNGATASDLALAPPGVAVGRFPARTKAGASALVAKTIAYESASAGPWQKQLAFVCGEGHFGEGADAMIENLFTNAVSKRVPDAFDLDVTYGNPASVYFYPPDRFSDRVTERLSEGALILNYIGHGGPESFDDVYWGARRYPIFSRADAEKVACTDSHMPIVLITACLTGAFDEPDPTVGEALILNPRGAVAVFAASRESNALTNALLSLELTSRLFKQAGDVEKSARPRLGDRLRAALDELSIHSGEEEGKTVVGFARMMGEDDEHLAQLMRDGRSVYNLLGDPALVIQYPRMVKLEAPEDATAGTTIELKAEGVTIERATLERLRKTPRGLKGLPEDTSPEALASSEVRERILATYKKANDFVVLAGAGPRLELPRDLAGGSYILKAWGTGGGPAIASARIEIEEAAPDPPEKTK